MFLQIHVRRSNHCKHLIRELIHLWRQMVQVRLPRCGKRGRKFWKHNSNADMCDKTGDHEFIMIMSVEIPQNSVAGQQRQQISELQFDKFHTPQSFLCWKIRFRNQVTTCSDCPSEAMLWINEVEMVDSLDELNFSRSIAGKNFPNFVILDARIASAVNKIIQNSHFKKNVSLEEQKAQKEDRFLRRRQIAFMIYDYFRVTGAHDTVLDYADSFSVTLRDDNIQEFYTRWDEVLLSMTKIPSEEILESLYKLRIRESEQLKSVLELYDMEIHQKTSMPNYQRWTTMVNRSADQKLRLRNFDARHEKIETGAVVKSRKRWRGRGRGICYQWEKRPVFEGRPVQFPAWEWWAGTKTDTESRSTLWAINDTRLKRVEKKKCQRQKPFWDVQSTAVEILLERYLHEITLWQLASSRIQECWGTTQQKAEEGWWQECRVAVLKDVRQLGCETGRWAAGMFIDLTEGHTSLGSKSTSTIHKSYAAPWKHPRKQRTIAW